MKKKILFAGLLLACLSFGVACGKGGAGNAPSSTSDSTSVSDSTVETIVPGTIPQTGLYTDIPQDTSVEIGGFFSYAQAAIALNGIVYEPTIKVTLAGEAVETGDGYFSVGKVGEYIISYTFTAEGQTYNYETKVTGVDTTAPSIVITNGEIPGKCSFGDVIKLPMFKASDVSNSAETPIVKVLDAEGQEVTVVDGEFMVESYGGYQLVVESKDSTNNVAKLVYDIVVYQPYKDGTFENGTSDFERIFLTSGKAELSLEEVTGMDGKPTNALKLVNTTSDPYITINFGTNYFDSMTEDQTLKFKVRWDPNTCLESTVGFILMAWDKQGGTRLFQDNSICRNERRYGEWYEYALNKEHLALVKESGQLTIRLYLYGAKQYGYDLYLDDIGIADNMFDGSLESMYDTPAGLFGKYWSTAVSIIEQNNSPEGSVNVIRIKTYADADNPVVTFNFGKLFVNSIEAGDTLSFRAYVAKGECTAEAIKIYMGTEKNVYNILPTDNVIQPDTWVTYNITFTQEMVESYRASGLLYFAMNAHGVDLTSGGSRAADYYLDDFVVTKAQNN